MADGWSVREIAQLVGEGLAVLGFASGGLVYIGTHNQKHKEIDAVGANHEERLDKVEQNDNCEVLHCPIRAEFPIVQDRQNRLVEGMQGINGKLDCLIDRAGRTERLEVKMDASERDRHEINQKLDAISRELGELTGALKFKG